MHRKLKRLLKFLIIFVLTTSWILSGWPQIWQKPPIPPKIEQVQAQTTIDVLPNSKHANDTTGDTLSGITGDDSTTENPDTLSKVNTGDNVYTVGKNAVMQLDTFDVSSIPDGSAISAAVLHLQYGAKDDYNGSNSVSYDNGGGLTTTGITPTDITGWSSDLTFDLYGAGVDTKTEVQNIDIKFTNNDSGGPDAIHFDYVWITVTYISVTVSVSVSDGVVTYGTMVAGASKSTLPADLNDMQTATNDGNVTENFNIKGQDATGGGCTWTLASTNGSDQYVHQFCNDTDLDCSSPPTNYTALTTTYQALDSDIVVSGTVDFQLRLITPNPSSCYGQQSVDVTIQAVQP